MEGDKKLAEENPKIVHRKEVVDLTDDLDQTNQKHVSPLIASEIQDDEIKMVKEDEDINENTKN